MVVLSLRDDGCLDVVRAIHQLAEDLIKAGGRRAAGDVLAAVELPAGDQLEGSTRGCRRVMEAGLERDVVVVETVRVEFDFGSGGTTAEEVDHAAFADHFYRLLPCCRDGDSFDRYVNAAI